MIEALRAAQRGRRRPTSFSRVRPAHEAFPVRAAAVARTGLFGWCQEVLSEPCPRRPVIGPTARRPAAHLRSPIPARRWPGRPSSPSGPGFLDIARRRRPAQHQAGRACTVAPASRPGCRVAFPRGRQYGRGGAGGAASPGGGGVAPSRGMGVKRNPFRAGPESGPGHRSPAACLDAPPRGRPAAVDPRRIPSVPTERGPAGRRPEAAQPLRPAYAKLLGFPAAVRNPAGGTTYFSEAMSITNRYRTSPFRSRS
jgi:hypothetical protein